MIIALAALTAGLLLRRPKVDVFYSPAEACRSCATFYPKKTPNWHEDDMAWARECRVGKCSFEPPWAGGPQDEACENWNLLCDLWKDEGRCESSDKEYMRHACKKSCNLCDPLKQTKYCLSFDPVAWFHQSARSSSFPPSYPLPMPLLVPNVRVALAHTLWLRV
eukprot:GEMP01102831.1.p1 GENE.GEMP01102831.1~~GEMP01102831.1.p1  ORF type:complete len:164 (+),score=27.26 GEMP01102831.1:30-521(+)